VSSGQWEARSAILLILWASITAFLLMRWHNLGKAFEAKTFTAQEFLANPKPHVLGPPLLGILWITVTLAAAFAVGFQFSR
jgi:hypothetical protein